MTTAGEAASLFGAVDSTNDPFSVATQNDHEASANDPFASLGPSPSAAEIFDLAAHSASGSTTQQEYDTHSSPGYEGHGANWVAPKAQEYSYDTGQGHYGYTQAGSYGAHSGANGWSNHQGQWAGYDSQQYSTVNGTYSNPAYDAASHSYDAYAPQAHTTYTQAYADQAPSTQTSAHTSYSTVAPTYNTYAPFSANGTASEPSYDPYKPQHGVTAPAPPSQSNATFASFVDSYGKDSNTTGPEPSLRSAVTTSSYRPKTSNAYDPPLPPPKPTTKRPHTFQSPHGSPAQAAYTIGSASPPASRLSHTPTIPPPPQKQPSLPPPPPRSNSLRQHTASPLPPPPSVSAYVTAGTPPPPRIPPSQPALELRHWTPPPLVASPPYSAASAQRTVSPSTALGATHDVPELDEEARSSDSYIHDHESSSYWNHLEHHVNTHDAVVSNSTLTNGSAEDKAEVSRQNWGPNSDEEQNSHDTSRQYHTQTTLTFNEPEVSYGSVREKGGQLAEPLEFVSEDNQDPEGIATGLSTVSSPLPQALDPYRPRTNAQSVIPPVAGGSNAFSSEVPALSSWTSPISRSPEQVHTVISSPPLAGPSNHSSTEFYQAPRSYPYESAAIAATQRVASPSTNSVRSTYSTQSRDSVVRDPYGPSEYPAAAASSRYRSMSNSSAFSTSSANAEDPYAPSRHSRQQSIDSLTHGGFAIPRPFANSSPSLSSLPSAPLAAESQVVTLAAPTRAQYAPSPSLLGSNDPLGRTSVRVPVVTFGFGGKLVTCFHGSSTLHTGFDIAMTTRASTTIHLRSLNAEIPQSAIDTSTAIFPGPLFADPGTPTTTLVRTGVAAQVKAKKVKVVKYLEERADEISRGIGYLHQGSVEGYKAEARRILINLLKVMVEHDGRLSGSPEIESAVRAALLPDDDHSPDVPPEKLTGPVTIGFSHDLTSSSYSGLAPLAQERKGVKIADHPLWSSQLDKIERLLVRGDRRGAYHYAADEKLWAHALIIASSIDKEAWKDVVAEFVHSELASSQSAVSNTRSPEVKGKHVDNREPLRVAYSLFAGQGAASVQELHPQKPLGTLSHSLSGPAAPVVGNATPMSAAFNQPVQPVSLSTETLAKWPQTVAMIMSGTLTVESSATLTSLGDHLAANNWIEAAHACYLLSPQTSIVGGVGVPGGRVVLYGTPNPLVAPAACKDPDGIIFSEIVEFALSLTSPGKGQEAFNGLPHLQPYRLLRAHYLAELGQMELASRYCDAISGSLARNSPYLNATFGEHLKGLTDRLIAAPHVDKSGSWIGSKMARPSLDKIGNWLEGRFTSFIAGEGDSPKPVDEHGKVPTFSGPFAHYTSISSATSSTIPSPQLSSSNLTETAPAAPPLRTGSAMALRPPMSSHAQIARASSAIDYLRRKPSPVPRNASASAASFTDIPTTSQSFTPYGYTNGTQFASKPDANDGHSPAIQEVVSEATPLGPQLGSWWSAADSEAPTPTAASFSHPDASLDPPSEGFVSLMDAPSFSGSSSSADAHLSRRTMESDDEDILGLGNSSKPKKLNGPHQGTQVAAAAPAPAASETPKENEKPGTNPASSGWFSRLWKRGDTPGPVKANLGDENTFYYDAEQKRWINKNAPPEAAKPSPPPPPPRAQTASPGMSSARPPSSPGLPPARPATAIDLTDGPPRKPPMRVRSNLVPSEVVSAPTTPAFAGPPRTPPVTSSMDPPGLDGPPMPGARARAPLKRNARSRYVDVFQQEGGP